MNRPTTTPTTRSTTRPTTRPTTTSPTARRATTRLTSGALAVALSLTLAACSKDSPSSAPTSASISSSAGALGSGTPTGGSTTAAKPVVVDQTTPEAAMTSWLSAMVAGEGDTVCALMATDGKAISSIPGAAASCATTITPMLDQLKELSGAFEGLTIDGATVKGDTATFESVTTEPPMAADVVSGFKAVRIAGKWYVTQA